MGPNSADRVVTGYGPDESERGVRVLSTLFAQNLGSSRVSLLTGTKTVRT